MNLEPKKMIQYGKTGFMFLKAGKGAFSLLRERLFKKRKQKKLTKKYKLEKRQEQSLMPLLGKRKKGVFRWTKVGIRAGLIVKERYF
ncbi:hypothetical protein [Anaerotignum sp.]|uniref:hypothetical protein n=1 Tax=Anaerotignum sp. TaxID=2039241 RepID=UPI002714CDC2|nr:hypothetical protein [Anaerotignum sp.]